MSKFIYGLVDPNSNKIRYVGQTDDLTKRLQQHCQDNGTTAKAEWIKGLKLVGAQPKIIVLAEVGSDENAHEVEYRWIYFGRQNDWPLTNTAAMKSIEYYSLQGYFERLIVDMEKPEGVTEAKRTWGDIKQLVVNRMYEGLVSFRSPAIAVRLILSHPAVAALASFWLLMLSSFGEALGNAVPLVWICWFLSLTGVTGVFVLKYGDGTEIPDNTQAQSIAIAITSTIVGVAGIFMYFIKIWS